VSRRYVLSEPAVHDLELIKTYLIDQAGASVARHVLREVRGALELLATRPGLGHIPEDLTDLPVKFWPVFSYLVIYNPNAKPLEVLRILHAARDIAAILEDPRSSAWRSQRRGGITGSRM
jgi:antitoxin ParD1/3/4/toxin ParE1/3/4